MYIIFSIELHIYQWILFSKSLYVYFYIYPLWEIKTESTFIVINLVVLIKNSVFFCYIHQHFCQKKFNGVHAHLKGYMFREWLGTPGPVLPGLNFLLPIVM